VVTPEELRDYLLANGGSRRDAARNFEISGSKVDLLLRQFGEDIPKWKPTFKFEDSEIAAYIFEKKCSQREAATHFGITQGTVSNAVRRYEAATKKKVPRQVMTVSLEEIAAYAAQSEITNRQLAVKFNVSIWTVRKALRARVSTSKPAPPRPSTDNWGYTCPPIGLLWKAPPQGQASA